MSSFVDQLEFTFPLLMEVFVLCALGSMTVKNIMKSAHILVKSVNTCTNPHTLRNNERRLL